jgi:Mg2+ and Co2+ transporter CorA
VAAPTRQITKDANIISIINGYNHHQIHHTTHAPNIPHDQTNTPSQPTPQPSQHQQQQQQRTYANVVSNADKTAEEQISPLKSLIDEFKTLITHLMNQNTMILSMLTTLINKHK